MEDGKCVFGQYYDVLGEVSVPKEGLENKLNCIRLQWERLCADEDCRGKGTVCFGKHERLNVIARRIVHFCSRLCFICKFTNIYKRTVKAKRSKDKVRKPEM